MIVLNGVVFSTVTTSPVSAASAVSSAGSAAGAAPPDSRSFSPLMTAVEVTVAPLTASMPSSP